MRGNVYSLIVVLIAHSCIARASAAGLLVNSDFETGDLSGWSWQPTDHAEPQMTTNVVEFNTTVTSTSLAFRVNPGGDQSYASGSSGGGTLSQNVFLIAGSTYQMTMDVAIQCVLPLPNAETGSITLSVGDLQIGAFGPGAIDGNDIDRATLSGTYIPASSDNYEIAVVFNRRFGNFPTPDYPTPRIYDYVDNISIVPESASLSLLFIVSISVLAKRRRVWKRCVQNCDWIISPPEYAPR